MSTKTLFSYTVNKLYVLLLGLNAKFLLDMTQQIAGWEDISVFVLIVTRGVRIPTCDKIQNIKLCISVFSLTERISGESVWV
jgi:hypothetical protein